MNLSFICRATYITIRVTVLTLSQKVKATISNIPPRPPRLLFSYKRDRNFFSQNLENRFENLLFLFYDSSKTKFYQHLKLANFFVIKLLKEMDLFTKLGVQLAKFFFRYLRFIYLRTFWWFSGGLKS